MSKDNHKIPQTAEIEEEDTINLLDLLLVFARHKKKILLIPFLIGCATAIYSLQLPEIYSATTTLMPSPKNEEEGDLGGHEKADQEMKVERLFALLQSRGLQEEIIFTHNLQMIDREKVSLGFARAKLGERSDFSISRKSGFITITMDDESPEKAAQIANDFVSELRELSSRIYLAPLKKNREFLEAQLAEVTNILQIAEANPDKSRGITGLITAGGSGNSVLSRTVQFRKKNREFLEAQLAEVTNILQIAEANPDKSRGITGLITAGGSGNSVLSRTVQFRKKNREFLEAQLAEVTNILQVAETSLDEFQKRNGLMAVGEPGVAIMERTAQLRQQVTDKQQALALAINKGVDKNPEMQKLSSEIRKLSDQLTKIESIRPGSKVGLENARLIRDRDEARSRYQQILGQYNKAAELSENAIYERYQQVLAEYETAKLNEEKAIYERYQQVLAEYETASFKEEAALRAIQFQVIDVALPPEIRSSPKRTRMVLMALVASGFAMCLLAFLLEAKRQVEEDPEQSEKVAELKESLRRL